MPQEGVIRTWLETKYGDPIIFQGICTIGRAESNNIILSKGAVSRHHAIIHERDSEYWIVDLGGLNGTLVNGERVVQSTRLKSGDLIRVPLMDFVFRQETVSAFPKETAQEITPKTETSASPREASIPSAITVPLPDPVKPTQQDELPFGLPPELPLQTKKNQKARVYIGPVDTQGLPKALPAKPAHSETPKIPEAVSPETSRTIHLPKQSDELLKITTPLSPSPSIEKSREVMLINASDVVVPEPEKPKASAVAETDSFLQPSVSQEAASSTKSVKLLQKSGALVPTSSTNADLDPQGLKAPPPIPKAAPKTVALIAPAESDADSFILAPQDTVEAAPESTSDRPLVSAKLDKPEDSSSIQKVSAESKAPKQAVKKAATSIRKEVHAKREVIPPGGLPTADASTQHPTMCPWAKQSMYIGLASIFLPFVGMLTAPVAIILGHSALNKINQSRGALNGRQSAIMGLYFGYISVSLISAYSILIYFLFFSPTQSKVPALLASPSPLLVLPSPSTIPSPATTETVTNPPSTDTSVSPSRVTPDLQVSTPASPTPQPSSPVPEIIQNSQPNATPPPAPPGILPTTSPTPPIVTTDGAGVIPSASPSQNNSSSSADTNTTLSAVTATANSSMPPAAPPPPAVYDPVVLNRLKDGMLLQPIPEDTSSRAYMDAESFNNCARLLVRPPEAKYAESVGDFLEDVKKRNPDPARLQILSAMYENYMAGIKRDF